LAQTELTHEHTEELNTFLKLSFEFTNFFTSCTLNDFRNLRKAKPLNLIFLMSHAIKIMHDSSQQIKTMVKGTEEYKVLQGSVNLIARVVPLIFEDKEFFMRSMWHEQAFFNN